MKRIATVAALVALTFGFEKPTTQPANPLDRTSARLKVDRFTGDKTLDIITDELGPLANYFKISNEYALTLHAMLNEGDSHPSIFLTIHYLGGERRHTTSVSSDPEDYHFLLDGKHHETRGTEHITYGDTTSFQTCMIMLSSDTFAKLAAAETIELKWDSTEIELPALAVAAFDRMKMEVGQLDK
ncbi:MAG: hypothetical protein AB7N71_04135 [Phycisphaerae bacterium]